MKISTGPTLISFLESASLRNESPYLRGGIFIGIGILGVLIAGLGLTRSLGQVRRGARNLPILDSLYVERVLGSGPMITVIGGGSGLPNLLRGLKYYTSNICAVVTVADDGGSSGRLRNELGIVSPGDIRNCLVALADSEDVMQQLMDYRFESDGQLDGHSFGNILIAALAGIGGDFYRGVEVAGELLAIRGRVVPSTSSYVTLVGSTVSGETLIGETSVGHSVDRLRSLTLAPADPAAHPEAVRAIEDADMIVIGPGSLFTSIVPNLLIPGITAALADSPAFKVYVCNVAEEPTQTEGYSVLDHLNIVRHYGGENAVDVVVANNNRPDGPTPAGLEFIRANKPWNDDVLLVEADVIDDGQTARHDPTKLSNAVAEAYRKYRGRRRRLPRVRLNLDLSRPGKGRPVLNSNGEADTLQSGGLMRKKMIEDMQIESVAEFMLMDGALMAHFNSIKLQRMFGDLVTQVERELFHDESMSVNLKKTGRLEVESFKIEAMLNRASDKFMNLIDRANNTMIRNIKAIRDLKSGSLSIRTDQVNIAQQQVNQVVKVKGQRGSRGRSQKLTEDSSTDSNSVKPRRYWFRPSMGIRFHMDNPRIRGCYLGEILGRGMSL